MLIRFKRDGFVRFLAQFSCQDLLQFSTPTSFKSAMAVEGWDKIDERIIDAMDNWCNVSPSMLMQLFHVMAGLSQHCRMPSRMLRLKEMRIAR